MHLTNVNIKSQTYFKFIVTAPKTRHPCLIHYQYKIYPTYLTAIRALYENEALLRTDRGKVRTDNNAWEMY